MFNKIRDFLTLGVIVGALPNTLVNGQVIDAIPVMADFNFIASQVNANAAATTDLAATNTAVTALQANFGTLQTFTPTILFGGANVGMTYATQLGNYLVNGNLVFFWAYVSLSAKGSSTGAVTLANLPFTISSSLAINFFPAVVTSFNVDYTIGGVAGGPAIPKAEYVANTKTMNLGTTLKDSSSGFGQYGWDDTRFVNTSAVRVSGFYPK